jgi:DNA-directed RNA polymerase omega subunit
MKKAKISRAQEFDRDLTVKNVGGSQFELVLLAAARARQLADENKKAGITEHRAVGMDALFEIQAGKFK